jgi:hypothetical protein
MAKLVPKRDSIHYTGFGDGRGSAEVDEPEGLRSRHSLKKRTPNTINGKNVCHCLTAMYVVSTLDLSSICTDLRRIVRTVTKPVFPNQALLDLDHIDSLSSYDPRRPVNSGIISV